MAQVYTPIQKKRSTTKSQKLLLDAFKKMCQAKTMAEVYEENFKLVSKYVHATSRGHEAIQLACSMQLKPQDFAYPYYRDDAFLLGVGMTPYDLMMQLLAKKDDPFSGGRTYYAHPSLKDDDKAKIPHQSSATGMQAIPATGAAMGMQYKELMGIDDGDAPVVVCSLGDASITEGEVAEAFQMAALRQLPILYLVQDNEWDISASADEIRAQDATEYIKGFLGIECVTLDGTEFMDCYKAIKTVLKKIRKERRPFLVHAKVPLLNHHTSGVRMEWYRDDLEDDRKQDPYPKMISSMLEIGIEQWQIDKIEQETRQEIEEALIEANAQEEPSVADIHEHIFAPSPITSEVGERSSESSEKVVMVDQALHAIEELMQEHKECMLYGQDVGHRLGGVFREAATLAQKFGNDRVFNTPIQEAYIIGSTAGMSAVGLKPIVEVQFADYIWPGLNQLFTEVARSNYLSNGKWPVSMILRVPIGAYGSGGPYHSSSVESVVANIRGVKIAYPSNGADLKGLLKSAYDDPNPVVIFEHKGLYWSKVPNTETAKTIEPDADYRLPFGKSNIVQKAKEGCIDSGESMCIVTYGMGVHWALKASKSYNDQVEIIDLRTLCPIDYETVFDSVKAHGRCIVLTEEQKNNSLAQALSGRIQEECFQYLDAPVKTIGSLDLPGIPIHSDLENEYLVGKRVLEDEIGSILKY